MNYVAMEDAVYVNYDERICIDIDMLIIAACNIMGETKISRNNREFFERKFMSSYDAAWAVSLGDWRWTDNFVCFDAEGFPVSFSHWDDENSPIDINKIDVHNLIRGLQDLQNLQNKNLENENNGISRAIHNALQEI